MPISQAPRYATKRSRTRALPAVRPCATSELLSSFAKRLLHGAVADPASNLCCDDTRLDGLGEIRAEAHLGCALAIIGQCVRRERDDRDALCARISAQNAGGLPSVHARNRDVHEDEVGQRTAREV